MSLVQISKQLRGAMNKNLHTNQAFQKDDYQMKLERANLGEDSDSDDDYIEQ